MRTPSIWELPVTGNAHQISKNAIQGGVGWGRVGRGGVVSIAPKMPAKTKKAPTACDFYRRRRFCWGPVAPQVPRVTQAPKKSDVCRLWQVCLCAQSGRIWGLHPAPPHPNVGLQPPSPHPTPPNPPHRIWRFRKFTGRSQLLGVPSYWAFPWPGGGGVTSWPSGAWDEESGADQGWHRCLQAIGN